MSSDLVYLAGPPAAGKSSLMAALTAGCDRVSRAVPFRHDLLVDPDGNPVAVELGRRRPDFPGTDTLSMSVSPRACRWLAEHPAGLVLGEGDRLATRAFLGAAEAAGYTVTLVHVTCPPVTLDQRCAQRGSAQNEPWRRGRATKAARLAELAAENWTVVTLDTANATPGRLAAELRLRIPALRLLGR